MINNHMMGDFTNDQNTTTLGYQKYSDTSTSPSPHSETLAIKMESFPLDDECGD